MKAHYFVESQPDHERALKYFKSALYAAQEIGFHPLSAEVLDIKLMIASYWEKLERYDKAVLVYNNTQEECLRWIRSVALEDMSEETWHRLFKKSVEISVHLATLYDENCLGMPEEAEKVLVTATEMVLKERQRQVEAKEPGDWLTDEEVGGTLEGAFE